MAKNPRYYLSAFSYFNTRIKFDLNLIFRGFTFLLLLNITCPIIASTDTANTKQTSLLTEPVIMGYYSEWSVYSPNVHIQDLPTQFMTHLIYKSAYLNKEGEVISGDSFADYEHLYPHADIEQDGYLGSFGQLIKVKKKYPKLRTVISIGGWGRSEYFSTHTRTKAGREKVARSAINFMLKYKFDGIELDWMYPIKYPKHADSSLVTNRPEDTQNLGLLVAEIRRQLSLLPKRYWLQAILAPYSFEHDWDAKLLSQNVDVFVLDISRIYGDKELISDHLAPLYAKKGRKSIDQQVSLISSYGIDKEKVVLSLPSYAVGMDGVSNKNHGLQQPIKHYSWGSWDGNSSGATGVYSSKSLSYILNSDKYPQYWDDLAKNHYLYSPERFGGHFITFESKGSVGEKVKYARNNKLAGLAVNQLHNGTDVLRYTFFSYHLFHGLYFKVIDLWQNNKNILLPIVYLFFILLSVYLAIVYWLSARNAAKVKIKHQQQRLHQRLSALEWPLLNLVNLTPQLTKHQLIDEISAQQLVAFSSHLLKPVNDLLTESQLNNLQLDKVSEKVDLKELLLTTESLLFQQAQCRLIWQLEANCQISSNQNKLQQLFYSLCVYCKGTQSEVNEVKLDIAVKQHHLCLILYRKTSAKNSLADHTQLKSLYSIANELGLQLKQNTNENISFTVIVPQKLLSFKALNNSHLNFVVEPKLNAFQVKREFPLVEQQKIIEQKGDGKHQSKTIDNSITKNQQEESTGVLEDIALFNLSSLPSKDIIKGLEQACDFFANYLSQDSKIHIYQSEQLISKLGDDTLKADQTQTVNADDFTIEITTNKSLNNDEEQLIRLLISQTQMIHKALKSLIKEPSILAELYELTRYKDRIKYLKAESGYTGIYIQSLKEPRYISMRLRAIKQYFDDVALIQVHRSYLVNPKKVTRINTIAKLKYELVLGSVKIPVSRTYIPMLKEHFPDWFL